MANRNQIEQATNKGVKYKQDKTGVHFTDGVRFSGIPDFTVSSIEKYLYAWGFNPDSKLKLDLTGCKINIEKLIFGKSEISNFTTINKTIKNVQLEDVVNTTEILKQFDTIETLLIQRFHGDLSILKDIKINSLTLENCDGIINFKILPEIPSVTLKYCKNFNSLNGITDKTTVVRLVGCEKLKNLKYLPQSTHIGMEKISLNSLKGYTINIDDIPDGEEGEKQVSYICETLKDIAFNSPQVSWQDATFICRDYTRFKKLFGSFGMPLIVYYYFSLINGMDDKKRDFKKVLMTQVAHSFGTEFAQTVANDLEIEI